MPTDDGDPRSPRPGLVRPARPRPADAAAGGPREPPIDVHPALTVEPLPSHYSRRAAAYGFVRSVLEEAFGAEVLRQLHRHSPQGPSKLSLAMELDWMQKLFEGAAATACRELGQEAPAASDEPLRCFSEWRGGLANDPDLGCDARMMVPVFHDLERRKTKVWAFLGWQSVPVDVIYRTYPSVLAVERKKPLEGDRGSPSTAAVQAPTVTFHGDCYQFAVPVLAEVYVTRLLHREEFRQHCDRYRTQKAILANLQ